MMTIQAQMAGQEGDHGQNRKTLRVGRAWIDTHMKRAYTQIESGYGLAENARGNIPGAIQGMRSIRTHAFLLPLKKKIAWLNAYDRSQFIM